MDQNPHQTVSRFRRGGFSMYACGFSGPQMRQFCSFLYPSRSKWASSEKMIFFCQKRHLLYVDRRFTSQCFLSVFTTIFVRRKDKTNYLSNQTWAKCCYSRNQTLDGGAYIRLFTTKTIKETTAVFKTLLGTLCVINTQKSVIKFVLFLLAFHNIFFLLSFLFTLSNVLFKMIIMPYIR